MKNRPNIIRADRDDAAQIAQLQQQLLLAQGADTSGGFLVSDYTKRDYIRFCDRGDYVFKAVDDNRIVGVLVALRSRGITPEDKTNSLLKYVLNKEFVVVKQVFVDPAYARQGLGTRFYNLLSHFLVEGEPVLAVIVKDPPNTASFDFHTRNGFSEFLEFLPDADKDGTVRRRSA